MKKKAVKKLVLAKETITQLTDVEMQQARGRASDGHGGSCVSRQFVEEDYSCCPVVTG